MWQAQRQHKSPQEQGKSGHDASTTIRRSLSMVKKTVGRSVRQTYPTRRHYPELVFQVETAIDRLRAWIRTYRFFF
jgi:hypothetical protein